MTTRPDQYLSETHVVENQPPPLVDYNAYDTDISLREAVVREGAGWADDDLRTFGAWAGSAKAIALGFEANATRPTMQTHDRFGERIDEIRFHPAYHDLMASSLERGLHGSPWRDPKPGAHVARAAAYIMQSGVEVGHMCPVTMTFASVPALRHQPDLARQWIPKVTEAAYDPRNVPDSEKTALTIGMAMTEKQGGSDVRVNTTTAHPVGSPGPGEAYELVGHKYFVSAPMCDAFLVLAQTEHGLGCFLVPRWRPDGSKNALHLTQLKNKMGNVSNASAETELRGALGWLIGEEGRGVSTILEMVALTRFDCMLGSSGGMRQATVQAVHHARHRRAFGRLLVDQPLMANVLTDLAIETEASVALSMRIARALDDIDDERERLMVRIGTAVGKYWICKRAPGHAYEAMECLGGMGTMEDVITARIFRESPINSVWEGSGNVQCLDVLRAIRKEPKTLDVLLDELRLAAGTHSVYDAHLSGLERQLTDLENLEDRARDIVGRMALALQASLLLRDGDPAVAEAFVAGRLDPDTPGFVYGALPAGLDTDTVIARVLP